MKTVGFIGMGNMGKAMLSGLSDFRDGVYKLCATDASAKAREAAGTRLPAVHVVQDNAQLAEKSDVIVLAVKPHIYSPVIEEIKERVDSGKLIITIAAGVTLEKTEKLFGRSLPVVRVMPNTPAQVGEGMAAYCGNKQATEEQLSLVDDILSAFGKTIALPEKLMNAYTALAGSSPAWVYMFIEALADGAVLMGMPRDKAYRAAAQSVLGSAKMVLETGEHPAALKDAVCSPGGTTIEAVSKLEEKGFRSSLIEAVRVCTEKADRLG